jgi:hypothetical protein
VLGFKVDWGGEASSDMASISQDGCSIMMRIEDPDGHILPFGSEPKGGL